MSSLRGLILTCEHATNHVPTEYRHLFRGHARVLPTHRAYDQGALELARELAKRCKAPLLAGVTTRLLVDLNRSVGHPQLFSEYSRRLAAPERQTLIERFHAPHWQRVRQRIAVSQRHGPVLHLAVHSFTPMLDARERQAGLGLLYDPARRREAELCSALKAALRGIAPSLRVRRNYPYRGVSDGLPTALRREQRGTRYLGIELEMNQALMAEPGAILRLANYLVVALGQAWPPRSG